MAVTTHIPKLEEAQTERAVQMRSADPGSPVADQLWVNKTDQRLRMYDGSDIIELGGGSGGGGLNFYEKGDAEAASVSDFANGNNAAFDGGGALAGTFEISTTAGDLIRGSKSFKFTQAGGSLNDYIASLAIDIPQGYRGRQMGVKVQYRYDGADDDMSIEVHDETAGAILKSETIEATGSGTDAKELVLNFFCPTACQQIKLGFHVKALNSGKILIWDDFKLTPDPFVMFGLEDDAVYAKYSGATSTAAASGNFFVGFNTTDIAHENFELTRSGVTSSVSGTATAITIKKAGTYRIAAGAGYSSITLVHTGQMTGSITQNANVLQGAVIREGIQSATYTAQAHYVNAETIAELAIGDEIQFRLNSNVSGTVGTDPQFTYMILERIDKPKSEHIVTPLENVKPVNAIATAGQSISGSTTTIIDFNTVQIDDQNLVTSGANWKYTCASDGLYKVHASCLFNDAVFDNGSKIALSLWKNGVQQSILDERTIWDNHGIARRMGANGNYILSCSKGDYLDVRVFHNSGTSKALYSGATSNHIQIEKVDQNATLGAFPTDDIPPQPNLMINGSLDFWQRGSSFLNNVNLYICDRIWTYGNAADWTRISPSNLEGAEYGLRWKSSSIANNGITCSFDKHTTKDMHGKYVTFSAYVRLGSAFTGDVTFFMGHNTSEAISAQALQYKLANFTNQLVVGDSEWKRIEFTSDKPIETDAVSFNWSINHSGNTSNANDHVDIALIKVELGSKATDYRRFGDSAPAEFAACQRYYYRSNSTLSGTVNCWAFQGINTSDAYGGRNFPVVMRKAPTINIYNLGGTSGVHIAAGAGDITGVTPSNGNEGGFSNVQKASAWADGSTILCNVEADAEL